MIIYLLLVFVCVKSEYSGTPANYSNRCSDQNHIFLTPGVLAAGASNRVCVSRFHTDGAAKFKVMLFTEDKNVTTVSRDFSYGDGGCMDIIVPSLPNTKADILVTLRYPQYQCEWERRATLRIASGAILVIHTEKARYRPGELVRARLFQLRADLTPVQGAIDEVWIEGPHSWEGSRMAQWRRVKTRVGVAQVQHQLEDQAVEGKWTIKARLSDGTRGVAAFQVGHYELPPFRLTVRHAEKVLRTSDRLVWIVCVRYPWSEAVEGMLVIRIRGVGAPNDSASGIRTAVRLTAPKACHRHAAAAKRIGLDGANSPDVVVADFSFQEEGTRIWQNTTVVSQVVDKPVSLEFLTKHRAIISPNLPYKLKIKATRWDGKPSSNERIKICRSPTNEKGDEKSALVYCDEGITDSSGVARIAFKADGEGNFFKFQGFLTNDNSTATTPLILPVNANGALHAALGPLKVESLNVRTLVPLYLSAKNIKTAITAHFVVITRGGTIYRWGTTTQCPIKNSADQIQTKTRNSPCTSNSYDYGYPEDLTFLNTTENIRAKRAISSAEFKIIRKSELNESLEFSPLDYNIEHQMLRIMLPLKVTHQMCPESHLIVYFYHDGEFVSASKHFEMNECFANKVEASWLTKQVSPSSPATLQLSSPAPALCALSATLADHSPPPPLGDNIIQHLNNMIYLHHNVTLYDATGDCFKTEDTFSIPTTALALTATWLAAGGIRFLGADDKKNLNCLPPEMMMNDEVSVPRTDFSEAWLWRLVAVSNGSVGVVAKAPDSITRYEATAICLSRTGIAISQPAVLQVFRDFFIHTDGAKRLRRGDRTIIKYRLFNYLYEPLSVQIQILTDPHLEGPIDNVEMACIAARSSIARRIEVLARLVGKARISVHAKSVRDGNCANATMSSSNVSDEVILELEVEPEGILVQDQKSIMLCGRGSPESNNFEVTWNWPAVQSVPDTDALMIWASGDITGPLLADADDLILLPRGCGEQNLARMATNLLAFMELDPKAPAYLTAKEHIIRGYSRQLQYAHPSGGFSAFGSSDATPSTWLTAFAVRYLKKAHQILYPDQPLHPVIQRAEQWLFGQQMENGCFRNEGQVFHRELKGGLNEDGEIANIGLAAYVITSLIDTSPIPAKIIRNTLHCLRAMPPMKRKNPARVYVHSLLGYAFMKLQNYEEDLIKMNEASATNTRGLKKRAGYLETDENMKQLLDLLKVAKRSQGYVWWETGSLSTSIEATSYALLALSFCPPSLRDSSCAIDAHGAIQWLSTHRNPTGGFVSTQDTLIALEALTAWYNKQPGAPANLTAVIQGSTKKTVRLWSGMRVPETINMGHDRKVNVKVEGSGCAIFQATRSYYSLQPEERGKVLSAQVTVNTEGQVDCDDNGANCFCAAVVQACILWTQSFPEMALLEISLPGGYEADPALLYEQLQQNDSLLRRIELTPTNTRATLYLASKDGNILGRSGHQCYKIHALGPKSRTKPAYAKVMDYYKPDLNDTQMYSIPEECPAKILPINNDFSQSDNLYIKPKSLNRYGEVLSSNDFSSEDIPDGIPLEDTFVDNLTDNKPTVETKSNQEKDTQRSDVIGDKSDKSSRTDTMVIKIYDKIELLDEVTDPKEISFNNSERNITPSNQITFVANKTNIVGDIKDTTLAITEITTQSEDDSTIKTEIKNKNNDVVRTDNTSEIQNKGNDDATTTLAISNNDNPADVNLLQKSEIDSEKKTNTSNGDIKETGKSEHLSESLSRKIPNQAKVKNDNTSITFESPVKQDNKPMSEKKNATNPYKSSNKNEKSISFRGFFGDRSKIKPPIKISAPNNIQNKNMPYTNKTEANLAREGKRIRIGKSDNNFKSMNSEHKTYQKNNTLENSNNKEENNTFITKKNEIIYKEAIKEENKAGDTKHEHVDNPNLSDFHVIDTEKDLAVPSGVEGPVPMVVLPPPHLAMMNGRNNALPVPFSIAPVYPEFWQHPNQAPRVYPSYMEYSQDYWRNYWRYYSNYHQ